MTSSMTEADVVALFAKLDNSTRWGDASSRGTLNFQTPANRARAAAEVLTGDAVAFGRALDDQVPGFTRTAPPRDNPDTYADDLTVSMHGFAITHLDAVGHTFWNGSGYRGAQSDTVSADAGLPAGDVTDLLPGVFGRGVLLDIAAVLGRPMLDDGYGITLDDILAAEARAGVTVASGDVVIVRSGLGSRGPDGSGRRAGILPEVIAWLYEREVAVYAGDCIEQLPSGYPSVPMPLHQIGHTSMGLAILDNVDVAALARACADHSRAHFLVVCTPLAVAGGSGSPVNPVAVF